MFEKIKAARAELQRISYGNPNHAPLDALYGAFQSALEQLEERIRKVEVVGNAQKRLVKHPGIGNRDFDDMGR